MKTLIKLITVTTIMLTASVFLYAEPLDEGKDLYFRARDMMGNNEEGYLDLLDKSKSLFDQINDEAKKNYWLARLELRYGFHEMGQKNDKKAKKHFEEAMDLIKKSLKIEETSDSIRVLSDSYMYLMNYKGFFYQAKNGTKLKKLPEKALSIDPDNSAAMTSLGIFHINAPAIAGASKEKAVKLLSKAAGSDTTFDRFNAYIWLAQTHNKMENKDEALKAVDRALEIYPDSGWAKQVKKEITEKTE